MADYRQVHTKIWDDPWFVDLEPLERLCFIWLITNESASVSGLYEFSIGRLSRETGIDKAQCQTILQGFIQSEKIMLEGGYIWIKNLRKYNDSGSPNAFKRIMADFDALPDGPMKRAYAAYYKHTDKKQATPTQPLGNPLVTPTQQSGEQGIGNREQGTLNIEHRTLNTEQYLTSPLTGEGEFSLETRPWIERYIEITGIKPEESRIPEWEREARDCIRVGIDSDLVQKTVDYMRSPEKKLTVGSPKSIFKTAQNIRAAETAEQDTPAYKKYLFGDYARFIQH